MAAPNPFLARVASVGSLRIVALLVQFGFSILTIRIITSHYGLVTFGAVTLIATLIALVPIADLGLGTALTNVTTEAAEAGDFARLRRVYSAAVWILLGIGALVIIAGFVMSALRAWSAILGSAALLLGDPNEYMLLYTSICGFWLVTGVGFRILAGLSRTNTLTILQSVGSMVSTGAIAAAAMLGAPAVVNVYFPLVASMLTGVIAWVIATRLVPRGTLIPLAPLRLTRTDYRGTLSIGLIGFWFTLGAFLLFALDRLLLSNFADPLQVAAYALLLPLFSAVQTTLEAIGTFLWPHYTRLRVRGEFAARTVYRHAVVFLGLGLVAGLLLWLVAPIYTAIAADAQAPVSLAIAFGALAVAQSLTLAFTSALTAPRLLRLQGIGLVAAVALKVALAPIVLPAFGATGIVALSVLAVLVVQLPSLLIILRRNFPRAD